jgi:hypothetical protein
MPAPPGISVTELVAAHRDEYGRPVLKVFVHGIIEAAGKAGLPIAIGRKCDAAGKPRDPVTIPAADWFRAAFPFASRDHEHDLFWIAGGLAYVEIFINIEEWNRFIAPQRGAPPDVFRAFRDFFWKLTPEEQARSDRGLARRFKREVGVGSEEYVRKDVVPVLKGRRPRRPKKS